MGHAFQHHNAHDINNMGSSKKDVAVTSVAYPPQKQKIELVNNWADN